MKNPAIRVPPSATKAAPVAARTILVLLRHGDAGDALALPERDAARPLTPKGHKQAKRAGKALSRMGLVPRDVWTSRLQRAVETARTALVTSELSPRVTPTAALAPDATPERILRTLADTPPAPEDADADVGTKPKPRAIRAAVGRRSRRPIEPASIVRWLVGHDPHLARLAALATGAPAASIRLPKGAFAVISFDGRGPAAGTGVLHALLDPDALKAVVKHRRS